MTFDISVHILSTPNMQFKMSCNVENSIANVYEIAPKQHIF